MPKIKNILIFVLIGVVLTGGYLVLGKKPNAGPSLVSSSAPEATTDPLNESDSQIAKELLGILLNVKSIHLEDSIFSEEAFISLKDSSILLVQDGNEGRPNPFAPIGTDLGASAGNTTSNTPVTSTPSSSGTGTPVTNTGN